MTDSDVALSVEFIADLRRQIEDHQQVCQEKIQRIRQRAEADERHEQDRLYFETEPLRRQMEAMIKCVAAYESLKGPASVMVPKVGG